jgi:hypothetical protein
MTKTLAAAKRLRTIGGLVELHSSAMADLESGDLSSSVANGINRLSSEHLRESKKQRRFPTEDELSELGAAVVALLTKPGKRTAPTVRDSLAKPRRVKKKKV